MSTETDLSPNILVFLPQAAAQVIVTKLAERGYASVAVSTVSEVLDALRSDCYAFAITTRPEIDLLRNIRSIPVVNLEIFFHAEPSSDGPLLTSKRFDGRAFMERIQFLVQSTRTRAKPVGAEQAKGAGMRQPTTSRLWAAARNMSWSPRQRQGLRDVQS
jgi:hypothetical protein